MVVEFEEETVCKECGNKYTWIATSIWNQRESFVGMVKIVHKNVCHAEELGEPINGVHTFRVVCPSCGADDVVKVDLEIEESNEE